MAKLSHRLENGCSNTDEKAADFIKLFQKKTLHRHSGSTNGPCHNPLQCLYFFKLQSYKILSFYFTGFHTIGRNMKLRFWGKFT